jgi:hypothetical protein
VVTRKTTGARSPWRTLIVLLRVGLTIHPAEQVLVLAVRRQLLELRLERVDFEREARGLVLRARHVNV